ncbi:hypothetical protein IJJ49_02970 [Candidatus Saccharibacteria bacterium]|nr:hypothetical protein [Candidatus Saccharibacteria bacterium]
MTKKNFKIRLKRTFLRLFFGILAIFIGANVAGVISEATRGEAISGVLTAETVYAEPEGTEETSSNSSSTSSTSTSDNCQTSLGEMAWLVCPTTGKISEAVDWLYEKIEDILVINPIAMEDGTPIYEIWKYCLGVTNVVFIIFLLIVIYSQITGFGINNYGVKKALPKLIVAAVLVNLSFIICSIAVDVSNIIGSSLRGVFTAVEEATMAAGASGTTDVAATTAAERLKMAQMYESMSGGAGLAIGAGIIAFETGAIWMLIPVVLGAIVAVATGLITIALRQAVVALLIMISPLAFVAYILPNTEDLFKKWKKLLTRMLTFYPLFSLLFGASSLAGFAIIAAAKDGFGLLLGMAVQIFPLFFSWKLMQMSGTFLGDINTRIRGIAAKPLATNRAWADSHRMASKQKYLAGRAATPSLRLMQFVSNRRIAREAETEDNAKFVKERGLAYRAKRRYIDGDLDNGLSRKGLDAYEKQAKSMEYQRVALRDKNNFNKGFGYRGVSGTALKARMDALDIANVNASDMLKVEQARGERIEYDNAVGFYNRMEGAMNAHMDMEKGFEYEVRDGETVKVPKKTYKFHFDPNNLTKTAELARYTAMHQIMEGSEIDVQFAVACAAQAYDKQKKILETKMQKYFEMLPPTKDVEFRLEELTKKFTEGEKVGDRIDAILPGLRILNQRGDTDLVKKQLDNILDKNLGGGIELGTHASQALASFLMFEVKDNDPFLRRFGKYINLETARIYNKNDRQVMDVTYDEYVRGYHDGEPATDDNPTGRMFAKKGMKTLLEGTSLDNIERTALANLDDSLKKAYGYDENDKGKTWDFDGYIKKREEIQTAIEPAFLSASLKWLSGSEQINSGVKFWTGYEQKQKTEDGRVVTDENGDPVYELAPVWKGKEFVGHEDELEEYYRRKSRDYIKDQTTGQILGMRTDYRDALAEHFAEMYLEDNSDELPSSKRKEEYERRKAEIQTRYGDKSLEEAKKLRDKDLKNLRIEMASAQIRKTLGETGKLEQIYRTRRSGAANNAKDWWRRWIGLDDEEAMLKEVTFYKAKRGEEDEKAVDDDDVWVALRIFDESARRRIRDDFDRIWDKHKDSTTAEEFYDVAKEALHKWFGGIETQIEHEFDDDYKRRVDSGYVEAYDLKKHLEDLLGDPSKYPDA